MEKQLMHSTVYFLVNGKDELFQQLLQIQMWNERDIRDYIFLKVQYSIYGNCAFYIVLDRNDLVRGIVSFYYFQNKKELITEYKLIGKKISIVEINAAGSILETRRIIFLDPRGGRNVIKE